MIQSHYCSIITLTFTKEMTVMIMNKTKCDVLRTIQEVHCNTQRNIAEKSGHSLGMVNKAIKELKRSGFITDNMSLTNKAEDYIRLNTCENAIIIAAGPGIRMVPINVLYPKAFLKVKGEALIERLIKQLHSAGIRKIYIVVGFMKEQFEYLIDKYDVQLIVNRCRFRLNGMAFSLASARLSRIGGMLFLQ